jgi:hypothetical protein
MIYALGDALNSIDRDSQLLITVELLTTLADFS